MSDFSHVMAGVMLGVDPRRTVRSYGSVCRHARGLAPLYVRWATTLPVAAETTRTVETARKRVISRWSSNRQPSSVQAPLRRSR